MYDEHARIHFEISKSPVNENLTSLHVCVGIIIAVKTPQKYYSSSWVNGSTTTPGLCSMYLNRTPSWYVQVLKATTNMLTTGLQTVGLGGKVGTTMTKPTGNEDRAPAGMKKKWQQHYQHGKWIQLGKTLCQVYMYADHGFPSLLSVRAQFDACNTHEWLRELCKPAATPFS